MTTSEYQYALQRGATFLVMAAFSLVLLAGITGSLLSGSASTNASSVEFLHKFSGRADCSRGVTTTCNTATTISP